MGTPRFLRARLSSLSRLSIASERALARASALSRAARSAGVSFGGGARARASGSSIS